MDNPIDKMKGKMSDMGDSAQERYDHLRSKAQEGTLDESERTEYSQLEERFGRNE